MTDWRERLRALDDAAPAQGVYERARQGSRRPELPSGPSRARRFTAGITAFAVFALAAAFAWHALRPIGSPAPAGPTPTANEPSADISTYADPLGWKVDYPSNWVVTPVDIEPGRVSFSGATISNVEVAALSPNPATPAPGPLPDAGPLPSNAVLVTITHREGGPAPDVTSNDSQFPLTWDESPTAPGSLPYAPDLQFRGNGVDYTASVFVGPDASEADIQALDRLIGSIRFPTLPPDRVINGWVSLIRPVGHYRKGVGTPEYAGPLSVIYVMRGPQGDYVLDLSPDGCGESPADEWDANRLEVLLRCSDGSVARWERDGSPVAGNRPGFRRPLDQHPVITAWNGDLLVGMAVVDGLAEQDWPYAPQ